MKKCLYITSGFLILSVISCNNGGTKENEESTTQDQDTVQAIVESQVHSYALPSPLQIASIFKNSGIGYLEGITNQEKNSSRYSSNFSKAVNLGVYSADMAYSVLNQQTQEATNYIKLSKELADELGMGSVFEASGVHDRFEKNIGNKDSLISIIADLQMETDMYLDEAQRQSTSLLIYSGAWIESMYIGAKFFEKNKSPDLSNKISEQMTILGNMLKLYETNNFQDKWLIDFSEDMRNIRNIYDNFESVKKYNTAIEKGGEEKFFLLEQEVASLSKAIQDLRSKIIMN